MNKLTRQIAGRLYVGIILLAAAVLIALCAIVPETRAVSYNPSTFASPIGVYKNVAAGTATTTVKSGPGVLYQIVINTAGASANTLTCYDNTAASGTKIATIDDVNQRGALVYFVAFSTGLTCISATGTGADYTVSYYPK